MMCSTNSFRGCVLCLCILLCVALCDADADTTLKRMPYLQLATPNSIYIVWRTEGPSEPIVRYGATPTPLDHEVFGDSITTRVSADVAESDNALLLYQEPAEGRTERERRARERAGEDDAIKPDPSTLPNTFQYEALISGLAPSQKHYYAVYDGARKLAGADDTHFFTTLPEEGSPTSLRLWLAGDTGTRERMQYRVYEAMLDYVETTSRPIDMFIIAGDMAYDDGTDVEFSRTFFDVYESTLRNTVFWPTMGNHEGHISRAKSGRGPYFDAYVMPTRAEAGGVPSGTEAYYSFQVGSAHFICLDSDGIHRDHAPGMIEWLRADVEKADADWMIAFWHHPPYSKGTHDSDEENELVQMRTKIMPILEAGGVDAVLTGHSHIYERSMLMDGAYETPTTSDGVILDDGDGSPDGDGPYRKSAGLNPHEGTVQIVSGHGATAIGRSGTMPVMREIIVDYGSVLLDIDDDTLVGRMIDKDGQQRDLFSIVKRGKVKIASIESPWQPQTSSADITQYHFGFRNDLIGQSPAQFRIVSGEALVGEGERGKAIIASATNDSIVGVFEPFDGKDFEMRAELMIASDTPSPTGLVLRYKDPGNYYFARLDAQEGTFGLYRVVNGESSPIAEVEATIPLDEYFDLMVSAEGARFAIGLRGGERLVARDATFSEAGKIGFRIDSEGTAEIRRFEIEK